MRVLYFHQYFTTPSGSSGTRSYEMAKRLIARGHQVTMVCANDAHADTGLSGEFIKGVRRGSVDGIDVVEFDLPYSNYLSLSQRARQFCRYAAKGVHLALSLSYDVLFSTSTPLTAGIPGIFAKVFRGKPFVFEVRDLWPELPRAMGGLNNPFAFWALRLLERKIYHRADRCIGLSPGIVRGICRQSIPENHVFMIPNGCDLDLFDSKLTPLRYDSISRDEFVAVFTGAHGQANGLDAVLDAASILRDRCRKDIHLIFIGDGKCKPELQRRSSSEKLLNCVFLDPVPKYELAHILRGSDAGLMVLANIPAFYDGTSPNKFFDYIASGLPVLNNYPGWLAEMLSEHECGLVVAPDSPSAFADALEYMADHRAEVTIMGENSRHLAEATFSREMLADRFVDILESVVDYKE